MQVNNIGNFTELVAETGQYLTQSAEVWDNRVFVTRHLLGGSETQSDWRDATAKEYADYQQNTPPEKPKRTALTPLFEAAGATFNDETGYYELNTLTDITEDEMIAIYNAPRLTSELNNATTFSRSAIRTNLCGDYWGNEYVHLDDTFYYNHNIEVAYIKDNNYNGSTVFIDQSNTGPFYMCIKLRSVLTNGYIKILNIDATKSFYQCYALEDVKLSYANVSFSLQDCGVLSTDSVRTIIEKEAAPSSGITVTLHPDVYDRVIADEGVQAALEAHPHVSLARYEETEQTE